MMWLITEKSVDTDGSSLPYLNTYLGRRVEAMSETDENSHRVLLYKYSNYGVSSTWIIKE